ncbi:ion transport protein domain-containing protein [Phthorimaea operculella]|nr:ion transport protein domain-containing protein [Phthorimaea operculella]
MSIELVCMNHGLKTVCVPCVSDSNVHLAEILLDALKKVSPGLEFAGASHSTEFPSYVTPLILAAQLGYYEIVTMLLSRGHTIAMPHPRQCQCVRCLKSLHDDPLYTSTARLATYRAISSPVYLIHEAADQILAAFLLSAELAANADAHLHFAAAYLKLRDQVSAYAVDLIGCCRTSVEVELILMQTSGYLGQRQFELPRLLMAMDYKQMEFVAHPHTQQVLESHWQGDWHSWSKTSTIKKVFIVFTRILITPFILLMCVLVPRHYLVRHWRIPLNKLITHASAYFVFLALVFHISNQDRLHQPRGPPNTGAEAPLVLYVCGYTWSAIRMCLMQGPRRYFSKMWNWAEVLMLGLFGLTFAFWVVAGMDVTNNDNQDIVLYVCGYTWSAIRMCLMQGPQRYFSKMWNWAEVLMLGLFGLTFAFWVIAGMDVANNDNQDIERRYWNQYDPTLLAEGTFCLATIIAFFRLMQFCQLNYHLGPLQVSLGKMTIDIYKYIIVFTIIISAFAAGLARFYQYYEGMVYEDEFGMKTVQLSSFTSLPDTLKTLFWALFCMAPLESADVVLVNTQQDATTHTDIKHRYTERVGYFCFGCFEVISVIVVLNMLIATMSNTFQRVTDNVAIEWTFGRTEVYVDYMWQTTLASPLNMVPTAAAMSSVLEWLRLKLCRNGDASARWSLSHCCYITTLTLNMVPTEAAMSSVLEWLRLKLCRNGDANARWSLSHCCYIVRQLLYRKTTLALNMVPTAAAMSSVLEWLRLKLCGSGDASARWSLSHCCYIERDLDESLHKEYPALMTVLVQRYFKRKAHPNFT